jgi:hypothetical protein
MYGHASSYQAKIPRPATVPLSPVLVTSTAFLKSPGTILPSSIVSSTIRGTSCGVTRPYEMYAPDGNKIYASAHHRHINQGKLTSMTPAYLCPPRWLMLKIPTSPPSPPPTDSISRNRLAASASLSSSVTSSSSRATPSGQASEAPVSSIVISCFSRTV